MLKWFIIFALFAVMNVEKLQKMAGTVRTGGKGTVRRYVYMYKSIALVYSAHHSACIHTYMATDTQSTTFRSHMFAERRRLFTNPTQPMIKDSKIP